MKMEDAKALVKKMVEITLLESEIGKLNFADESYFIGRRDTSPYSLSNTTVCELTNFERGELMMMKMRRLEMLKAEVESL